MLIQIDEKMINTDLILEIGSNIDDYNSGIFGFKVWVKFVGGHYIRFEFPTGYDEKVEENPLVIAASGTRELFEIQKELFAVCYSDPDVLKAKQKAIDVIKFVSTHMGVPAWPVLKTKNL